MDQVVAITRSVEGEAISAVTMGFSFAAAIAWMDVIRWYVSTIVKANKASGQFVLLSALFTTVLTALMFLLLKMFTKSSSYKKKNHSPY